MFVDYTVLPEEARVWIYPSSRKFYPNEITGIQQQLKDFVENWKPGDKNFKASYQFLYNRFIILLADNEVSPLNSLEIDQSVQFILQLQQTHEVQLLDKMNVCFKQGDYVQYKELKDFKKLIKNRTVSEKTIVFDNVIQTKKELENSWEVPITESWYQRFL